MHLKIWLHILYFSLTVFALSVTTDSPPSSLYSITGNCRSFTTIPTINDDSSYVSLGDLNIGGFIMATYSGDKTSCSKTYRKGSISLELAEAIAYAVKLVNEDPNLLPNISLGFVLLNDCSNTNIALAKSLQFLPQSLYMNNKCGTCACDPTPEHDPNRTLTSRQFMTHYDVIGVISSQWSSISLPMSQLFSTSSIPLIGCTATSDELSDKARHPFFLRITAADRFQVEAMLEFIQSNGWSYVSVLHAYGSFGEKGYEYIKFLAPSYNICIATHHKVNENTDFDLIVQDLLSYQTARVVILFIYVNEVRGLFNGVNRNHKRGTFIWVGSDGLGSSFRSDFKGYEDDLVGTFVFSYYKTFLPGLYDYIGKLNVNTSTNPWLQPIWENLVGCSFKDVTCVYGSSILDSNEFAYSMTTSLYVDAVMVFAHAVTRLMADLCPGLTGREARTCIQGDDLLQYMTNLSFQGYSGYISFDENGDVKGKYDIQQVRMGVRTVQYNRFSNSYGLVSTTIAMYNISSRQVHYTGEEIIWDHLSDMNLQDPLSSNTLRLVVLPESICSRPCLPGEYVIQKDVKCCWECRTCRDNEKLIKGNTNCEECDKFTWPDPDTNFTTCRLIDLTFPSLSDPMSLTFVTLGLAANIFAVTVCILYYIFRDSNVIKASSKELSFFQLIAIVEGYITVILLQLPPTDKLCNTLYFVFCLSFASLYSPLLVKSERVHRIFLSSSKFNRNLTFVSCYSQIGMTLFLISIQIIICLVTHLTCHPTATKSQPVLTEQYVEFACDMTISGLVSFLTYNLVLVLLCSVLAFKTRKLPDNFNESWFIFMCVATTLIVWLAFVPTYFTTSRQSVKILMLSVTLLLNHTVALTFLFVPKIYAAAYAKAETKSTIKFQLSTIRISRMTNRVAQDPNSLFLNS